MKGYNCSLCTMRKYDPISYQTSYTSELLLSVLHVGIEESCKSISVGLVGNRMDTPTPSCIGGCEYSNQALFWTTLFAQAFAKIWCD